MAKRKVRRTSLKNARGVYKVEIWNNDNQSWAKPLRGKPYLIRQGGNQTEKYFQTVQEALRALNDVELTTENQQHSAQFGAPAEAANESMTFLEACNLRIKLQWSGNSVSTNDRYNEIINRDLKWLHQIKLSDFSSSTIDNWLDTVKKSPQHTSKKRLSFKHELDFIRGLFNLLVEEDLWAQNNPVKKRHYKNCVVKNRPSQNKDLTWEECQQVLPFLKLGSYATFAEIMLIIQFWHALRMSELAALKFEDIFLDFEHPENSMIKIGRKAVYRRGLGSAPEVGTSVQLKNKNSRILVDGKKVHRLFPVVFDALKDYWSPEKNGLLFHDEAGNVLKYKVVYNIYTTAFKKAGFAYSGTHILRHGGTREILNMTGDLTISQQHLGNSSLKTTMVYAQRDRSAFDNVVKSLWNNKKRQG